VMLSAGIVPDAATQSWIKPCDNSEIGVQP
jgi:hypothetical protein